ncbi:MAG: sugar ABC transporter permease [Actinomycetota bacterium]
MTVVDTDASAAAPADEPDPKPTGFVEPTPHPVLRGIGMATAVVGAVMLVGSLARLFGSANPRTQVTSVLLIVLGAYALYAGLAGMTGRNAGRTACRAVAVILGAVWLLNWWSDSIVLALLGASAAGVVVTALQTTAPLDPPVKKRGSNASTGGISEGWKVAIWFLLPSMLGFFLFFLLPSIRSIGISFQDFSTLTNEGEFIGVENYRTILEDRLFWNAIWVTMIYVVINIGSQTVLALGIAVMMDRLTKSVFVRGVLLVPWLLPNVMVGLLWLFMLDPRNGIVNEFLAWFGIDPIGFLSNPDWAMPALALINTWKFTGYTALLFFAGMQTVPSNLYEAGALDGASEWTMFRTITLPLLRPVLALVMVISLIGSFQVFDVIAAAGGGLGGSPGDPVNSTRVLYLYIFDKAFVDGFGNRAGQGAAAATLLMLGLLVISVIQLRLSRAGESDLA